MRASEIRVKRICVNQGLGVFQNTAKIVKKTSLGRAYLQHLGP